MKPFNIEEAKAGKPVVTRDGRKARIICFDKKSNLYPIVALVDCGNEEEYFSYTINGQFTSYSDKEHYNDLFMAFEKKEYWVNVYKDDDGIVYIWSNTHKSEHSAINVGRKNGHYLKTIKIHEE